MNGFSPLGIPSGDEYRLDREKIAEMARKSLAARTVASPKIPPVKAPIPVPPIEFCGQDEQNSSQDSSTSQQDSPEGSPPAQEVKSSAPPKPVVLEGEVLDAPAPGKAPRKGHSLKVLGILEEHTTPPDMAYLNARQAEMEAIAQRRQESSAIEQRRGNRRPRRRKVSSDGRPVRNLPASEDPIISRRRIVAMPYWNRGWTTAQVREKVNEWLVNEQLEPVGMEVIRADKDVIYREWEMDFDASSAKNRATHIAALNRMKQEAWAAYEDFRDRDRGATAAATFLKTCVAIEAELAVLDGSKKRAEVAAQTEAETGAATRITRVYLGVDMKDLEDVPPKALEVHE